MESKGLGLMVTLQLYKQNLDSFLDRNGSEQPLNIKRHHDLVVVKFLTRDIEDEMQWVHHHERQVTSEGKWDVL